jgi:hypothetical protein
MFSKRFYSIYDKQLSIWNYIPQIYSKYVPQEMLAEYLQAQKQPKIIHFKPYAVLHYTQHFDKFWKYATRTPFCDEIIARMDKYGVLGKGLFDKVCLAVRNKLRRKTNA